MKKIGLVLAIISIIALAGCAGGGGGGRSGGGDAPLVVDLTRLAQHQMLPNDQVGPALGNSTRNLTPFARAWDGFLLVIPEGLIDVTRYSRLTIKVKYFDRAGNELAPLDSMGMVTMITDLSGDWRGPGGGPGRNTPVKEFNIGGYSGLVNRDRGIRHGMSQMPRGILFQRAQDNTVAFIEMTHLVFHNGNYDSGADVVGGGPEGS